MRKLFFVSVGEFFLFLFVLVTCSSEVTKNMDYFPSFAFACKNLFTSLHFFHVRSSRIFMHPRPPGRHIGIDCYPLILSFELKFFVCRHVSIWGFQNRVCLSVRLSICPYPRKRNHPSFVNVSPTLVIDTSMERSSRVLHHGNPKIWFFQKSSNFDFWRRAEITLASSISVLH